jgi:hypothetical protein
MPRDLALSIDTMLLPVGTFWLASAGALNLSHLLLLLLPPLLRAALAGVTAVLSMLPSTDHVADAYEGVRAAAEGKPVMNWQQAAAGSGARADSNLHASASPPHWCCWAAQLQGPVWHLVVAVTNAAPGPSASTGSSLCMDLEVAQLMYSCMSVRLCF